MNRPAAADERIALLLHLAITQQSAKKHALSAEKNVVPRSGYYAATDAPQVAPDDHKTSIGKSSAQTGDFIVIRRRFAPPGIGALFLTRIFHTHGTHRSLKTVNSGGDFAGVDIVATQSAIT